MNLAPSSTMRSTSRTLQTFRSAARFTQSHTMRYAAGIGVNYYIASEFYLPAESVACKSRWYQELMPQHCHSVDFY